MLTVVQDSSNSLEEAPAYDIAAEKALVWKQDLRIVPLSAFIYLLCYLDRSNIGKIAHEGPAHWKIMLSLVDSRKCQGIEQGHGQRPSLRNRNEQLSIHVCTKLSAISEHMLTVSLLGSR